MEQSVWQTKWVVGCFFSLVLVAFFLPISESLTDISYLMAFICAVVSGVAWTYRLELIKHPVIIVLWLLLAMIVSGLTYSGTFGNAHTWKLLKTYLWVLATPFLLLAIRDNQQRRVIFHAFLWANALILCVSFGRLIAGWLGGYQANPCVFRGHIIHNFFMSFASAIWLYFAIKRPQYRRWMVGLFVLSALNVFLVSSRTGYLNWFILVALVMVCELSWRRCLILGAALVSLVGGFIMLSPMFLQRMDKAVTEVVQHVDNKDPISHPTSMGIRVVQLTSGWHLFMQKPWLGYGTGGASRAFSALHAKTLNEKIVYRDNMRTDLTYINVAVEHGVLGLVILSTFILTLWCVACRLPAEWRRIAQCFVVAYFVAAIFTAFLISSFAVHALSMMLVVLYGGYQYSEGQDLVSSSAQPVSA